MDEVIKLVNVYKEYKMGKVSVSALKGISLDIKKGEFVSIIGPSGSGKSTCINMIGCLDTPNKGIVYLDGKNIAMLDESNLAQIRGKKIGFIFQNFNLIKTLSALDNVSLPMIFQNIDIATRHKIAKKYLSLVGLEKRMHHMPSEMSGGEQQRVAIARSLVNDPEVLLCDEPTGNLDSKNGKNIIDFLLKLNREQNKTIIIVTHDNEIAKITDIELLLKDGQLIKKRKKR
ncbi:ABC transporter ATP-binding protein [Candidatus Woesearchaeota archaeon]|jgi:putative ABC transport system ATP-binding protein|nr:ABC transporter ATP-binding protein [Candidatus Woesearchaeota archaeon]MBT4387802.1 ABC transporter ATP-binding protein [Candidatus Woesearchaeota archaeon]MBT4595621.1 ABC transporter ATP-binding protein [Candidatus Woesearchaeota archaeon]MBT5740896.1 ABC transporter ATP-binding protein [Candidatus Woesearchaeota archaeon]MBT6505193.1 ABC transporter ATP-binding protein [Candidatus Woesearchaeota archaeon]